MAKDWLGVCPGKALIWNAPDTTISGLKARFELTEAALERKLF
jgi:hypothetical protein